MSEPCIHAIGAREECSDVCFAYLTQSIEGVSLSDAFFRCELELSDLTSFDNLRTSYSVCFGDNATCSTPIVNELQTISSELYSVCFFALIGDHCTNDCLLFLDSNYAFLRRCVNDERLQYSEQTPTLLATCYPECNWFQMNFFHRP